MQKGLYRHYLIQFINSLIRKRITLQFIVIGMLLATPVFSQNVPDVKVTLQLNNADIKQSLVALHQKSGIRFSFGEQLVNRQSKKVTVDFKDTPLSTAVKEVLKGTNLSFSSLEGFIVIEEISVSKITNRHNNAASQGQVTGVLKGRVVEFETSEPLPGASIYIVELNKPAVSDSSGYYRFTGVKAGRYTLRASFVNYTTANQTVEVKTNRDATYDIKMQGNNQISEVVITATGKLRRPVAHTSDRQVLQEIKNSPSVVSGISSQQISMSADRNAAEVVKKISGVTIKDDKFIIIRGMNERYNLTYLNGNIAPSTELYSRAFSLDLLPSRIIDRILVYKSPAPDLMADMTGGAVKIYTKDAVNVKHFDIELQLGYRTGTTFNKNFLTSQGSATDFLGFDNGMRKLPSVVPGYGDFTKATISQKDYVKNFSPYLQYGTKNALPMGQLTLNYYNSFKLGTKNLSMLSSLSYKSERQYNTLQRLSSFYEKDDPTLSHTITDESQSTESNQVNLLQNFSLKLNENNKLAFKNYVLLQGQNATIQRNSRDNANWRTDATGSSPAWTDNTYRTHNRNIILSYSQRLLYSSSINGEHKLTDKHRLDWLVGYTYSRLQIPDQRVIRMRKNQGDFWSDLQTAGQPDYTWIASVRPTPGVDDNDNGLERGMISRTWTQNVEHLYNGSADYTFTINPWLSFKAGTYQQWKERTLFRRVFTLNEGDLNNAGYPDVQNIGGNGRFIDFDKVFWKEQDLGRLWSDNYIKDDGSGLKVFDRTGGSDAYIATEQLNAGYAALSLTPFNKKVEIYGGVRLEYDRQKVGAAIPPDVYSPGGINTPVLVDNKKTDILPSVNISYKPFDYFTGRVAYGKTVNRPEFRELSPYSELDYLNNQTVQGNNELISASIQNFDARIELYPHNDAFAESFSVGIFYKKIDHPIERTISKDLRIGGPVKISYTNADKATVKGVEIDLRKSLSFIPWSVMRNFSVIGNLTLIKSQAVKTQDSIGRDTSPGPQINALFKRQLQGQAPYSASLGLYYENAGLGTRVSAIWNVVGPRIYAAGKGEPFQGDGENLPTTIGNQGSLLELKRQTVDLAITQRIKKTWQVKLSGQNLLNQTIKMAEDENFTYKYEKAQFTLPEKWINKPFVNYTITGDPIASEYKPGRHYVLSLLYSF